MKNTISKTLFSRLYDFTKPFHIAIIKIIGITGTIAVIEATNTYFMSRVFDLISENINVNMALFWCSLVIVGIVARLFLISFKDKIQDTEFGIIVENCFNEKSIEKFLTFSNGQHINQHSGVKQNIVISGIGSIRAQLNMIILWLAMFVANFIVSLIMLLVVNLYLGLYYVCGALILAYLLKRFHSELESYFKISRELRDNTSKIKSDIYRHAAFIKNEAAEEKILDELKSVQNNLYKNEKNISIDIVNKLLRLRLFGQFLKWSSIFTSILFLQNGTFTIGQILLIFLWSDKFIEAVWVMTDAQKQFINDKINIEKYFELIETESDLKYSDNPIKDNLIGDIEFKNVCFYYPNREKEDKIKTLLNNLSFTIKSGEKIGIVGESGSGKSTIANLIRRAFDPQSGSIFTNRHDIKDIDIKMFLKQIGSVEQEIILFDKSIRENISFGLSKLLTDEELNEIAKSSGVHKFYHKLEKGWDTTIGEGGCKLSGGEKQRVGIARALAKKPQILIFDEATSALDIISEREVQEAIEQSCNGKTAIIIAHRLSTVKDCDRIFVMKDGKLLAADNHNTLFKNCEYYNTLVKNQLLYETK